MTRIGLKRSLGVVLLTIVASVAISGSSRAATEKALNDFLAKIQDAKGDVRRAAWESAGKMGADAVAPLGKILAGKDRAAAKAAERALEVVAHYASRPGGHAERMAVTAALIELARKGNPAKVRDKALRLLGSTGQDNAVPAIAALLGDKEVWETARWALERIPGKTVNRALIGALNKPPRWEKSEILKFREAIISTLGAKKSPEAVEPLMRFVRSDQEDIRIAAIETLGRIGGWEAARAILKAARARSGREKAIALDNYLRIADPLAQRRPETALLMYRNVLTEFKDEVPRSAALVGIGKMGGSRALGTLLGALSEASPRIRNAAADILTKMGRHVGVGGAVGRALELGRGVGGAVAGAIPGSKPEVKIILLRVLVDRGDRSAADVLRRALLDPDGEVRLAALALMGNVADPYAAQSILVPQLLLLLEKQPPGARKVALQSYLDIADMLARRGPTLKAMQMYHKALNLATEDAEKRRALQGIAAIGSLGSLETVKQLMEKPALQESAATAYIAIALKIAASGEKRRAIGMLTQVVESPCSVDVIQLAAARLKELGVVIPIAQRSGFATRWWLIGPFPNPNNSAWEKEFPPEKEVDLKKGVEFDGKSFLWKEVTTGHPQARVNLEEYFKPTENVAAYTYTEIEVPKETEVKFKIGSDDSVVCWLNGERIHAVKVSRGLSVDQDVVNTTLQAGNNKILLKILNEGAQWEFCLRITDRQDRPIDMSKLTK